MKISLPQRIIAGLLATWMSGVVLLFCCGNMEAKTAETDFCPLSKSAASHCDKKSSAAANAEAETDLAAKFQKESKNFDCCGFLPKLFDKARVAVGENQKAAAKAVSSAAEITAPKFLFSQTGFSFKSPKIYQPVIHNRGSTHLKNCVFRI